MSGKKIRDRSSLGGDHMRPPSTASAGEHEPSEPRRSVLSTPVDWKPGNTAATGPWSKTLRDIAQLTWQQILFAPRKGMGFEKIPITQLRVTLDSYADSIDDVICFRISEKWRLIGHRSEAVLRVLYIDGATGAYKH